MSLTTIYVTRHGFRSNWVVDPKTGEYNASIPSPTGIPSDPALAGSMSQLNWNIEPDRYGVEQSHELAAHLKTLNPTIERVYSSPFYRCIQTITPTVEALLTTSSDPKSLKIRAENGIGEWYGKARFDHPSPASIDVLSKLFSHLDVNYQPVIIPTANGEGIHELHDRCAYALHRMIEQCDKEDVKALVICTHAASMIAIGRALTGMMPEDITTEDIPAYTCSLTTYIRKPGAKQNMPLDVKYWAGLEIETPHIDWRGGNGVGGGWGMVIAPPCGFLSNGEERGWRFSGDESFIAEPGQAPALDAGSGLGVIVESKTSKNPSRL